MSIPVSSIKDGRCYETAARQQRRVTKTAAGKIWRDSRSSAGGNWSPGHPKSSPTPIEKFAAYVEREIPCTP
jgi:hypothetical protein